MPRPPVLRCLAVMAVTVCLLPQTPASATTPPGLPPAWGAMPTFFAIEDVPFELVCADYVSDPDTPLEELRLSSGSPYVTSAEGLVVSLLFPEGVLEANVTLVASDGASEVPQTLNFTVEPVNDPPRLKLVQLPDARLDEPYSFNITAVDEDNTRGELHFEDDCPVFDITASGTIAFIPCKKDVGYHPFNITVRDPEGLSDEAAYSLFVPYEGIMWTMRYVPPLYARVDEDFILNLSTYLWIDEYATLYLKGFPLEFRFYDDHPLIETNETTGACVWRAVPDRYVGEVFFKFMVWDNMGRYMEQEVKLTVLGDTWVRVYAGPDVTVPQHELVTLLGRLSCGDDPSDAWTWWFHYRGETVTLRGRRVLHRFDDVGSYTVHLMVSGDDFDQLTDSLVVTVTDNDPPVARIWAQSEVRQGYEVLLNGSESSDNVGITRYDWRMVSAVRIARLEGRAVLFTFDEPGVWWVTLTVTDGAGLGHETSTALTVLDTERPVAMAGGDRTVQCGHNVVLDGSSSTDNVGIMNYTWTITGAGKLVLDGVRVECEFRVPGSYAARLDVTDGAGNIGSDVMYIMVRGEEEPDQTLESRSDPGMAVVGFATLLVIGLWRRRSMHARKRARTPIVRSLAVARSGTDPTALGSRTVDGKHI